MCVVVLPSVVFFGLFLLLVLFNSCRGDSQGSRNLNSRSPLCYFRYCFLFLFLFSSVVGEITQERRF